MKPRKFNPKDDYPLASKRADLIKTLSGKNLNDVTMKNVISGKVDAQDMPERDRVEDLKASERILKENIAGV